MGRMRSVDAYRRASVLSQRGCRWKIECAGRGQRKTGCVLSAGVYMRARARGSDREGSQLECGTHRGHRVRKGGLGLEEVICVWMRAAAAGGSESLA